MESDNMYTMGSQSTASLKAQLIKLENLIHSITEEINFQKKEVQILRSEKDTLEDALNRKAAEVKKSIEEEVNRVDSDMRNAFKHQKSENNRLQQQASVLKQEKMVLQQNMLALKRRCEELELQVGANRD